MHLTQVPSKLSGEGFAKCSDASWGAERYPRVCRSEQHDENDMQPVSEGLLRAGLLLRSQS